MLVMTIGSGAHCALGLREEASNVENPRRSDYSQSGLRLLVWGQERSRFAAGEMICHSDVHGRPARSGEIRRPLRRRRRHYVRNAGGRATDDAIRSLVISHKLLGTLEWFVIHHTNCGMELFADEVIADLLRRRSRDRVVRRQNMVERAPPWRPRRGTLHQMAHDQEPGDECRPGRTTHP